MQRPWGRNDWGEQESPRLLRLEKHVGLEVEKEARE